jgi:hypothetical protein
MKGFSKDLAGFFLYTHWRGFIKAAYVETTILESFFGQAL